MASEESDVGDSVTPGGRRQRPPATIDLTATEVAGEVPSSSAPPTSPEPSAEAPQAASDTAAAPERATASSTTEAMPPPARGRRGGAFLAALTASAITLAVAAAFWWFGASEPVEPTSSDLAAKVAALEVQVRGLAGRSAVGDAKAIADITARLDAISQALRRLDGIETRLGKLESAPAGARPPATDPALAERVAAAEAALRTVNSGIADLRARLDALAEKATNPPANANAADRHDLEALGARVAALEASGKALDERLKAASRQGTDTAGRLALVALELRVAVERGQPFVTEVEVAKALIADKSQLAPLEAVAATGVPTQFALSKELANLAPALLRAAGTPAHESGLLERLQANAERLVRIRPINEAPGTDPSTVIVRAEVKATRGDLAGALAEINSLPAEIKAPAASWIKTVEARLAAVQAARQLALNALEALSKPQP
jgi:hypothetical protein